MIDMNSNQQSTIRRVKIKKNIHSIAAKSTIHGIPNLLNSDYRVMKLIWVVCFMLAFVYSSYISVNMIISFYNYDVSVTINYESDYFMDFPAIAFCDFKPMMNRSVEQMVLSCTFNSEPCDFSYFGKVAVLWWLIIISF